MADCHLNLRSYRNHDMSQWLKHEIRAVNREPSGNDSKNTNTLTNTAKQKLINFDGNAQSLNLSSKPMPGNRILEFSWICIWLGLRLWVGLKIDAKTCEPRR